MSAFCLQTPAAASVMPSANAKIDANEIVFTTTIAQAVMRVIRFAFMATSSFEQTGASQRPSRS
jgi:predicted secreted protein